MVLGQLLPIGSVIHSMLTEAQFQAEMGSGWVISDGRSSAGSRYQAVTGNANVPDMRGRFLRGKGANNPDGDLALGTYTADKFANHNHVERAVDPISPWVVNTSYTYNNAAGGAGSNKSIFSGNHPSTDVGGGAVYYTVADTLKTADTGSNETAPKSITVNVFIRIN